MTLPSTATISGSYPLTVGGDSNTKIASVIGTGSGTLTKDGAAGVLTLTGSNTYTGGTTITAGTLQLGDGGTTGKLSTSSTIINDGILKLDRSNGIVQGTDFKGGISGTGSVTITGGTGGTGITTLDGGNTYQGGTTVSGGTLNLTHTTGGSATGTGLVTIASEATLTGTGVIGGSLTVDGTHSPGNSPGVTSVGGDVTYNSTSIFNWELTANTTTQGTDPAFTYDQVLMTGTNKTLTIDPNAKIRLIFNLGTVDFANTGFWNTTQTWNIISGYTSFSGNFIIDSIGLDSVGLGQDSANYPIGYPAGVFSMSGGTLTWSAVPEPTGVLAGLLLGAGLLRRRR
ncbi:MAG: autotransporter-associated beta strand repeat-containing protein [Verrucomicrobia bacterium]|nr:autotransporter-associated beta strand repeat-containing protein [Verrucomicrobiota bacterium]